MNIRDIVFFEPQLAKVESGKEPSMYELLISYYSSGGHTTKESLKLADKYIAALEKEFTRS